MFRLINSILVNAFFCSRQDQYKSIIYSSFDEYKSIHKNFNSRHNLNIGGLLTKDEMDSLSDEAREDLKISAKKQTEVFNEIVSVMRIYCKKYPNEKICSHYAWKTYDEYPYRLEQSLTDFIDKL